MMQPTITRWQNTMVSGSSNLDEKERERERERERWREKEKGKEGERTGRKSGRGEREEGKEQQGREAGFEIRAISYNNNKNVEARTLAPLFLSFHSHFPPFCPSRFPLSFSPPPSTLSSLPFPSIPLLSHLELYSGFSIISQQTRAITLKVSVIFSGAALRL